MSSQDYLATAFVRIRPNTVGFAKDLRKQVNDAILPFKPKVLIAPSTVGFAAKVRTEVREAIAKSGKHFVPVTPVVTSFRREMARQLSEKPIPVTVQPVQTTPLQKVGAGPGRKKEIAETKELTREEQREHVIEQQLRDDKASRTAITRKLAEVNSLLAAANRQGISAAQAELLVSKAQTIARQALLEVTLRQAGAEGILAQERLKLRVAAAGRTADTFVTDAQAAINASLKEAAAMELVEKEAAEEKASKQGLANITGRLALAKEEINLAIKSGLPASEREAVLTTQVGVAKRLEAKITEELFIAKAAENDIRAAGLVELQAEASLLRISAQSSLNKAAADAQTVQLDKLQKSTKAGLVELMQVEVNALTKLTSIKAHEADINAILAETEQAIKLARQLGLGTIEQTIVAQQALIKTRLEDIAAQKAQIKTDQLQTTSQKNLRRGILATSLTFLGARGATLAAGSSFLIGAAAATALAKAVGSFASFEQELNVFQATADATADEMERVNAVARQLGTDITLPAVGAADAAAAMTNLAKAGLDVQDSLDGARGVLQLATAAGIENAQATELVASALNSFGLAGTEATKVADLLTGAANEAQGTITDMGIALQQSSAVARQAGLSLEDTVAFITLLAQNGIRGSDAGTSLRTALLRLIAPTETANKELRKLGITILDSTGNVRPEAFAELNTALSDLDATARNQVLRKIFGQDAIRAAVIFGREGKAGLNAVRDATQEAGLAAELAKARTKGFSGQVAALKNNAETLGLTFGKLAIGPLGAFVDTINESVHGVNVLTDAIGNLISKNQEGDDDGGFLGRIKDVAFRSGGDQLREIGSAFTVLKKRSLHDLINTPLETAVGNIKRVNKEILKTVGHASSLNRLFSDLSAEEALSELQRLRGQIIGTSDDAEAARAKIDAIVELLIGLGRKPTRIELQTFLNERKFKTVFDKLRHDAEQTKIEMQMSIGEAGAKAILAEAKAAGKDSGFNAAIEFARGFGAGLDPKVLADILKRFFGEVPKLAPNLVRPPDVGGGAQGLSGKQILNRIAGFDAAKVRAELHGSTAEMIAVLEAEQAFINQQLQRQIVKKQPGLRRQLESAGVSVKNDLASIAEDRKADTEEAADKIEEANKSAADDLIRVFSGNEQKLLNKQTIAAQSESLKDDLATDKALVALYQHQKNVAIKQIKDKEALRDFLEDINQKIFKINIEISQDRKKLNQQLKQQARDQREKAIEGINLDIEFAVITENRAREIELRRKLIRALQDQIKHERGNTNKIKELRNEIARQKVAIKEANDEAKERNNSFKQLLFEQLQAEQGFATQLLGNLFPTQALGGPGGVTRQASLGTMGGGGGSFGGATGGGGGGVIGSVFDTSRNLVTPRTPDEHGQGVRTQQGLKDAKDSGPTRGGQSREIFWLERIARILQQMQRGQGSPEAKYDRNRTTAVMDTEHGHG